MKENIQVISKLNQELNIKLVELQLETQNIPKNHKELHDNYTTTSFENILNTNKELNNKLIESQFIIKTLTTNSNILTEKLDYSQNQIESLSKIIKEHQFCLEKNHILEQDSNLIYS